MIGILFAVSVISFLLIRLLQGDTVANVFGYPRSADPAGYDHLKHIMGFDQGIVQQYLRWMKDLFTGNLHYYTAQGDTIAIWPVIKRALPIDFEIILLSQIVALAFAMPLGLRAARRPNGLFDRNTSATTFVLLAVPSFVLLTYLIDIVVSSGVTGIGPGAFVYWSADPIANLKSLIIPVFVVSIGTFVVYFRVFRTDLISTYQEEFITMARSKGLRRRRITWRHAVRPSIVPLLGTMDINIPALIAGLFIVEIKMAIPGLGTQLIYAVEGKNIFEIQAIVMIVASVTVILNFAIDLSFGFVDPRISRE